MILNFNCKNCNILLTDNNRYSYFSKKSGKIKKSFYCKACHNHKFLKKGKDFKEVCLKYKGGSCIRCGYNKCNSALEFHHRDPFSKEFSIAGVRNKIFDDTIKAELDKCDLLCSNCHREEHEKIKQYRPIPKKEKQYKKAERVYKEKISWPELDILISELKVKPYTTLSKELGVSDNAIRRRLKSKGINPKTLEKVT